MAKQTYTSNTAAPIAGVIYGFDESNNSIIRALSVSNTGAIAVSVEAAAPSTVSISGTANVAQVALAPSGLTPVSNTFTGTGTSASFIPIAGRDFNITISGGNTAIQVERAFGNTTWFVVVTDSMRTSFAESFSIKESEANVSYRLNCTSYTSGTVTYRISQ